MNLSFIFYKGVWLLAVAYVRRDGGGRGENPVRLSCRAVESQCGLRGISLHRAPVSNQFFQ